MNATVLASTLGNIFKPLFQAMAWLIAFFYALVPNYAVAIALLTVVVMVVTAPLTVKSTKSMVAMQRLSPELKKLQQKYKGDRQKQNEEMMKLYKEHGVNPAGGCLPMLIQFPVFIILYDVIRGLTNTVKRHQLTTAGIHCGHAVCASPRYIGTSTSLYKSLVHHGGKMPAFGIDLTQKVLGHHTVAAALPYAALIVVAILLQYLQMRQLNSRNPGMAKANPQAQMMQRYMPLIMAVIYINISAGVNIYFIVSSLCRIGLQEAVFRSGVLDRARRPVESEVAGARSPRRRTLMERLAEAQRQAIEAQQARQAALQAQSAAPGVEGNGSSRPPRGPSGGEGGTRQGGATGLGGGARRAPQGQARPKAKKTRKAR
jgi:YidC/Oxa1 family membrane protein insertase